MSNQKTIEGYLKDRIREVLGQTAGKKTRNTTATTPQPPSPCQLREASRDANQLMLMLTERRGCLSTHPHVGTSYRQTHSPSAGSPARVTRGGGRCSLFRYQTGNKTKKVPSPSPLFFLEQDGSASSLQFVLLPLPECHLSLSAADERQEAHYRVTAHGEGLFMPAVLSYRRDRLNTIMCTHKRKT